MTIKEIRNTTKTMLSAEDICKVLGSDPCDIRLTARKTPWLIGYPFTFVGRRMKIPRNGFLRWYDGKGGAL